ncbi:hypothetical protein B6E66_08205 [Streptomyces maremycinicus]|nr:hypothetical protein B6E66_08205 [Streptomyces sp. B9173]
MPWDELKQSLTDQGAAYTPADPVWAVTGVNKEPFRAHPAFLDEIRVARELPDLVTATGRTLAAALGKWRVTLDRHLADVPAIRAALGLARDRFTTLDEEITLLRYHDTARSRPGGADPSIAAAGTAFADGRQPATVHDFTQLHALFLAAVHSFGGPYQASDHPKRVGATYALALGSPAVAAAGPTRLGAQADWQTHQPGFALAVHAEAARLTFRTPNALAGHALKHLPRTSPRIPDDRDGVEDLIAGYLQEARGRITHTVPGTVTSSLAQTGTTRTYRFGTVNEHAAMVAVDPAGDAWISTYYAPSRV